jgi:hypothetical protein
MSATRTTGLTRSPWRAEPGVVVAEHVLLVHLTHGNGGRRLLPVPVTPRITRARLTGLRLANVGVVTGNTPGPAASSGTGPRIDNEESFHGIDHTSRRNVHHGQGSDGHPDGVRRDATGRPARVRAPGRPRRRRGGPARGDRPGYHPHRHQRFLRPARYQPDHPRSPAPLPGRAAHRDQGRGAARRRGRLAPGAGSAAAAPGRARQPGQPRARRARRGQPARRGPRQPCSRLDRRTLQRACTAAAGGADQAPRAQHRGRQADRRGPVHRAGRVRARTSTTWPTGPTTS